MSFALEFHDSEVRRVAADGDTLRIEFSAAAVRGPGTAHGWLPTVVATLSQAAWTGDATQAFGKLSDGNLQVAGTRVPRPALPSALTGAIALTLRFANGTVLAAHGRALALTHADDAHLAEDLSC
jgi:hypothetical protein